jgi:hypothetical protein
MPADETSRTRALAICAALAGLAALVVALATGELGVLAALVVLPLAAALFTPVRTTGVVAVVTVALVALAGVVRGDAFGAPHVAALLAVALAGAMAVALAVERREHERSAAFASYLGDAGTLLACSLDFDETAKAVASLPVPEMADWCLVELEAPDGTVERRAASHPDEGAEALAAALAEHGPREPGEGPHSELWRELPDLLLASWAHGDTERLKAMRSVGARSAIRVPLRSVERPLGTMLLIAAGTRRRFVEEDLRRAEDLAARCSIAIENAQLYRAARRGGGERRFGRRAEAPAPEPGEPRTTD